MTVEMNVFFKMMQKDDKKEVLKLEIKGTENEKSENELFLLSGSIVIFNIKGCEAGDVTAEFKNIQRDSKKTILNFLIKGDSEKKSQALYKYAGRNVGIMIQPSQLSIDEFYDEEGQLEQDAEDEENPDQLSLEDVENVDDGEAAIEVMDPEPEEEVDDEDFEIDDEEAFKE
ncbi:hypothetical protein [Fictibacillus fluitans]|uniref:Uncharacterized protein n=1 Tax=Fictibacillus fluitans TaxID=3058422 RepID=A0ABT8HX28_9BACL|nr:hypothetical protein [Fictibacillus sp. NE201]MDN4525344.1 hypothetical protein [Fictibacillus sp. NE201]